MKNVAGTTVICDEINDVTVISNLARSPFLKSADCNNSILYISAPEGTPREVSSFSPTSRSVYLSWIDISYDLRNGGLDGYRIRYKKYFEQDFKEKICPFGFTSIAVEDLKPFTMYYIEILGFNAAGDGPPEFQVLKTLEDGNVYICERKLIVH